MSLYNLPMDFRSIYRKDFDKKEVPRLERGRGLTDTDVVSGPYKYYLVPDETLKRLLPAGTEYENPACVAHRAHVKSLPDLDIVKTEYKSKGRSTYQGDFCRLGDFESEKTRLTKINPLPGGWVMPLTTQRCSYRVPETMGGKAFLEQPMPPRRRDNLDPCLVEREVLRVRTGDSEYMAVIGDLGEFILREKLFGEAQRSLMSPWEIKRRLQQLEAGEVDLATLGA